jgi:hypothetical protein
MAVGRLRIPFGRWRERPFRIRLLAAPIVDSANVREWLEDYRRFPVSLSSDPGAGPLDLHLRLPESLARELARQAGRSVASFLRSLLAAHGVALASTGRNDGEAAPLPQARALQARGAIAAVGHSPASP